MNLTKKFPIAFLLSLTVFSAVIIINDNFILRSNPSLDETFFLENTQPLRNGSIVIRGVGKETFSFNPTFIKSVRPDIFREGYFSIFDILVYLDNTSQIDMEYSYNTSMETYIINSIDNEVDPFHWWYYAYYDQGWYEDNAFRMDHYPVKENMTIVIRHIDQESIDLIYQSFTEEIISYRANYNQTTIPEVTIWGPFGEEILYFYNVTITPHNMRNDTFQTGAITNLDVILSLGDLKQITYELKWYESIGKAKIVKNYWISKINSWRAHDRCGWVQEAGPRLTSAKNHIHIPSDSRILLSPDYSLWFWICI